ncbi:hypothetical protein PUR59_17810 [Streptomyces sp. SP18ES09]|uniref:hypothetical protein n=1 Tax=Streptomyces sp. SP18ES09 TaxID=3002532 RepID=UPI002E7808C0|nr:hypothetical protein [Streptomyces sp. SP18ES09]MEE1816863.1 hypothetical protein [Streptomyces sp. SP18ES09]
MTSTGTRPRIGIAIASGMLKGVFGHGVLSAFEERGLRAQVYGTSSSAVLSGGLAAVGRARATGVAYWHQAAAGAAGKGMSQVVLSSIEEYGPTLRDGLFRAGAPEFLLATSRVTNPAAAEITQGPGAKELGRQLLRNIFKGDRTWVEENLAAEVFSSYADASSDAADGAHADADARGGRPRLTPENFDAVSYASTRMMHAWSVPAEVGGEAYVDASYTCACPAREVAATGVSELIVIGADPFPVFRDIYASEEIVDGSTLDGATVRVIRPEDDLKVLGVDYAAASPEGLTGAYELGLAAGHGFADLRPGLLDPAGTPGL